MSHILPLSSYYHTNNILKEQLISLPWNDIISMPILETVKEIKTNTISKLVDWQIDMMDSFSNIAELNLNEGLLYKAGYNSFELYQRGLYNSTLESITALNENALSTVKDFLTRIAKSDGEGITTRGILQFILDILGAFRLSMVGIPIDLVANLLNAAIYYYNDEYIFMLLNLCAALPVAGTLLAPFKLALKPAKTATNLLGKALGRIGGGAAGAALFANQVKKPGIIKTIGKVLGEIGKWLGKVGLGLLKKVVNVITSGISKVTFGAVDISKWSGKLTAAIDKAALSLSTIANESIKASEVLLNPEITKAASKSYGRVMGKASKDAVNKYTKELTATAATKFDKLYPALANSPLRKKVIDNEVSKTLMKNVIGRKSSLITVLDDPVMAQALTRVGASWKGGGKMVADAIKAGDAAQLGTVLKGFMTNKAAFNVLAKNSPEIAKSVALFSEAPNALLAGVRAFNTFSRVPTGLSKMLISLSKPRKLFGTFLLKMFLKQNECYKYIISNIDSGKSSFSQGMGDVAKYYQSNKEKANKEEVDIDAELSTYDLNESIYESTTEIDDQVDIDKLIADSDAELEQMSEQILKETDSSNPCYDTMVVAQATVGSIITANQAWQRGKYSTDIKSHDDIQKTNLDNYTKNILSKLGEATDIDPQRPLHHESPMVKLYFADIVTYDGAISANKASESRLDATIEKMLSKGELTKEQAVEFRKRTLEAWKTNTVPAEVFDPSENPDNFAKLNELIGYTSFNVKKLDIL